VDCVCMLAVAVDHPFCMYGHNGVDMAVCVFPRGREWHFMLCWGDQDAVGQLLAICILGDCGWSCKSTDT
jgi:hypothetical protein